MSVTEAYWHGKRDAQKDRIPLYAVLLAAGEFKLAAAYNRGWEMVTGRDLHYYRISGKVVRTAAGRTTIEKPLRRSL
jgi:hypothetical protein